jgi:hypothetical protein
MTSGPWSLCFLGQSIILAQWLDFARATVPRRSVPLSTNQSNERNISVDFPKTLNSVHTIGITILSRGDLEASQPKRTFGKVPGSFKVIGSSVLG